MTRRKQNSGWVRWPELGDQWKDSGEGGTFVYAFFTTDQDRDDSFVNCHEARDIIWLPQPDFIASDPGDVYQPDRDKLIDAGRSVLAAVCLGTSGHSYVNVARGEYFACTLDDFIPKGHAVLAVLEMMYERPPVLVTYLDT